MEAANRDVLTARHNAVYLCGAPHSQGDRPPGSGVLRISQRMKQDMRGSVHRPSGEERQV